MKMKSVSAGEYTQEYVGVPGEALDALLDARAA